MAAVTSFLVLAIVAVNAVRSDKCGSLQIGNISGNGIPLAKTLLQPGTADWEVDIPNLTQCPNGPTGVSAIVCDSDVLPTGQFLDKSRILVHRIGSLQEYGSVTPTVYCEDPWLSSNYPWQLNQRWPLNSLGLISQPQWLKQKNGQTDSHKIWDKTPLKLWDQKPDRLIARPQ